MLCTFDEAFRHGLEFYIFIRLCLKLLLSNAFFVKNLLNKGNRHTKGLQPKPPQASKLRLFQCSRPKDTLFRSAPKRTLRPEAPIAVTFFRVPYNFNKNRYNMPVGRDQLLVGEVHCVGLNVLS